MALPKTKKNTMIAYTFLLPAIVGMAIFSILPIFLSFSYSLMDWYGFGNKTFNGLQNYQKVITNPEVWKAVFNTIRMVTFILPISLLLSLIISYMLSSKIRGKAIFRVLLYLPVVTMPAAIAVVMGYIFSMNYGILNRIITFFGGQPISWSQNPSWSWILLVIVGIWGMIGGQVLILSAAFQRVPDDLYEVASIDGASPIIKFLKITIPMVSPTILFLLITNFISLFQMFDNVFMMIGTGSGLSSTKTIVYLFYNEVFVKGEKGYGAAIAVFIFVLISIFTFMQTKLEKKWVHYDN
ncbi:sugar ABC transporter permease [Clostridium sp.]|uniref:carbohydrate ABC transporter permease n=1 Tax=Clostridium sp. TaxID=1506 RepID=UPI00290E8266|nr:sugar ABC transporter permease [Clostridium sp.]MDU5106933.1 sugar ABC transporter permease [Clostridium sp.]